MRESYRTRWQFSFAVLALAMLLSLAIWLFVTREGYTWPKDLEVFYKAGERAAAGENLYRPLEDGFYHYKYSPAAALLFAPLSLMPLWAAGMVFRVVLVFVILLGVYLGMRLVDNRFPCDGDNCVRVNRTVLLAGLVLSMHFYSELTLGQVNQIVITLGLGCALLVSIQRHQLLAAALLTFSVFLKPYLLIFLPYLALKKRWRELGWFVVFTVALLLLPAVTFGRNFLKQDRCWLEMLYEQMDSGGGLLEQGNHTIYSFIVRWTPLRWAGAESWNTFLYSALVLLIIGLGILWLVRRGDGMNDSETLDFALLMSLVPLLTVTSENGFGFVELAILLLLFNSIRMMSWERLLLILGFLFFWFGTLVNQVSGPSVDPVLDPVHHWSFITAGTLVLFSLLCLERYRRRL